MVLQYGDFVSVLGAQEQVGKYLHRFGDEVEVEYFHSAVNRVRKLYPHTSVTKYEPPRQTRCYWKVSSNDSWDMGRLLTVTNQGAYIAGREGAQLLLPAQEVFVRCFTDTDDALALMHARIWDTPFFHSWRSPLQRALVRQNAATHGLSALLSAPIQLLDHQIQVVRRVLEDPIQRYLLADEVGLGKTIEAGVILRQLLIDKPNARALILVPSSLLHQWRSELQTKLDIRLDSYSVTLADFNALKTLRKTSVFDIVILDEAHHLARLAYEQNNGAEWSNLQTICHECPSLLLLTATPALHNEASFLAMLNLLEPQTYDLTDLDGFRTRIKNRDGVASALDLIQEDMKWIREVRDAAAAIREYLADDPLLMQKANELDVIADNAKNLGVPIDVTTLVREVRLQIRETHRVHRRMLRSSRRRIATNLFSERHTGRAIVESFSDIRMCRTHAALNTWRESVHLSASKPDDYLPLFTQFLNLAGTWPSLLRSALQFRLGRNDQHLDLPVELRTILRDTPIFDGEIDQLTLWERDLRDDPDESDVIDDLLEVLQHHRGGRRVVFTSYTSVAVEIVRRLQNIMHPRFIYAHLATTPMEERVAGLLRFGTESEAAILVCDYTGEEGLNLQYVDRVLHFDLPWDVNRLEQRIGRIDRIGRTKISAHQHIFTPDEPENTYPAAFVDLVKRGVAIFTESVADLQFFLDLECNRWVRIAFYQGAESLQNEISTVQTGVKEERILLRKQNALDEIETYQTDEVNFAEDLRNADDDKQQEAFAKALSGWMVRCMHFEPKHNGYGFQHIESTLLSKVDWERISGELPAGKALVYKRRDVLAQPGTVLLRPGNPFVDRLIDYLNWEDRGNAWALWRFVDDDNFPFDERAFFRFDNVIEADSKPLIAVTPHWTDLQRRPLIRQLQGWFSSRFTTVFVDTFTKEIVTDAATIGELGLEFTKPRDTNLRRIERHVTLDKLVPDYRILLDRSASVAKDACLINSDVQSDIEHSLRVVGLVRDTRINQLQRGLIFRADDTDIVLESNIYDAMIEGIRNPKVRIDALGLIVLSNRNPFVGDGDRYEYGN
jgi:ATP-dependent helicase HepA